MEILKGQLLINDEYVSFTMICSEVVLPDNSGVDYEPMFIVVNENIKEYLEVVV